MTMFENARPVKWGLATFMSLAMTTAMVGCGGGSGSETAQSELSQGAENEETQLMISLTDAEGDFLTYAVDVTSIALNRSDGAVVEVLTEETTVDFAQYVDISELLAVRSVPVGRYESVSLNVDFTNAQVIVQSDEGAALDAELVDSAGAPIEDISVLIEFGSDGGFNLTPRIISHITLDFDLDASNSIEVDGDQATVVVNPIWVADPVQEDPKPLRLRGMLSDVDEANSSFEMRIRPFRKQSDRFGDATVFVDSETAYEINGNAVSAEDGLASLLELQGDVPVIVLGSWNRDTREYTASEVLAGSSVPWAEADIMRGTVVARSGNEITVRGALLEISDGRHVFNDDFTLLVGEATRVLKRGEDAPELNDISVGSSLRVVGTIVDDSTLDATSGTVRVKGSAVSGRVVSSDPLQMDLSLINGRRAAIFDFSGTGMSDDVDADADQYEIDTGSLSLDSIAVGDPVRAFGFVREFGEAPEDFDAVTIVDASQVKGVLVAKYARNAEATPLSVDEDSTLLLNLENSRSAIVRAGIPVNLEGVTQVTIDNGGVNEGIYSIAVGRRVAVFMSYREFLDSLSAYLEEQRPVIRFTAQGEYDSLLSSLSSKRMQVHFLENDTE